MEKGAPLPLPLGLDITEEGCSKVRSAGYIKGTAALMIIAIMVDMFGTLLTGLGLRSTDPNKKYKYYRVAIYALIVASKYHETSRLKLLVAVTFSNLCFHHI